ncbi:MAG: DedA family protein [Dokdonella sp.]|uniref:DedA family protein n=1 Tax=Dokdonella sp. TaxID=2291710 RepID=UPI0032659EA3
MEFLDLLIQFFTQHGYLAVFAVLMICSLGIPFPEDITLVAGGVIAGLGYADVRLMCAVGLTGVLFGDSLMFLVGRYLGVRAMRLRWVAVLLTPRRYAQVQAKFDRYGNRLMFVARFLPGLRTAVFFTAGMTQRVTFLRFIAFDGFAALISVPFWVWLGYYGAENRDWLLAWIKRGQGSIAVLVGVAIVGAVWFVSRRAQQRRARLRGHRERRRLRNSDPPEA